MDAGDWDRRYRAARAERGSRLWSARPHAELRRIAGALSPRRALDLATGDGRNAIWLAERGWRVTAVDFSAEGLETARASGADVDWRQADVTTWSSDETFDLVALTYLHLDEQANIDAVRRAAGWVKPGGTLIVIGHDKDNLEHGSGGPPNPDILYTPELLETAAAGLDIETVGRVVRDTRTEPEGPPEPGNQAIDTLLHAVRPL